MEIFERLTHVVLHIYGNGLIFEELDDVNMTLSRRPVNSVITILSKQKQLINSVKTKPTN